MKRIEFISPVEAVRGNMSGNQLLKYADNNNPAWDAPAGTQYARNYQPRFIGAKVSKTGLKYFAVRTKSATKISDKTRKAMALLGGSAALYAAALKNLAIYANMVAYYTEQVSEAGRKSYTIRMFWMERFRAMLNAKTESLTFTNSRGVSTTIKNPWYDGTMTSGVEVSKEVLVKFWLQLAPNAIEFTVAGLKGIAKSNQTFGDILDTPSINVLGLARISSGGDPYVGLNGEFVIKDDEHITPADAVIANASYDLTSVAPVQP